MPSFNIGRALEAGYAPKEVLRYLAERGYQSPYEGSDEDVVRQHMVAGNRPYVTSTITYPQDDRWMYTPEYAPLIAPPPTLQGLSGPPASVPGSVPQTGEQRRMAPAEIQSLFSEQGIQPTLPPLSLMDLAMLATSGPEQDAGMPLGTLAAVRYQKPGVSQLAREIAERYHATPRMDPLGEKATVFHATDPATVESILRQGEIVPEPSRLRSSEQPNWQEFLQKERREMSSHPGYQQTIANRGVSVSRVPRVASKGSRAVSFVIDQSKMPPARPFAEPQYMKTQWWGLNPAEPNPRFEFEDRTYNTAIPTSAVREMWVDKAALPGAGFLRPDGYINLTMQKTHQAELQAIRDLAAQYGIPLREFESGKAMHAGRAGMSLSDLAKKKQ